MIQRIADHFGVTVSGQKVEIPRDRRDFPGLLAALGYTCGVEIGVWEGQFSERICLGVPGVALTCVDPWMSYKAYDDKKNDQARLDAAYELAQTRLAPYGCTLWKQTSISAAARIPDGSLDFVYIDGNHGRVFVEADLAAWAPKIRSGGIVAGHDYTTRAKRIHVVPAVDDYVARHQITPLFVFAAEKFPSFFWVQP